jgi:hypothetical protein
VGIGEVARNVPSILTSKQKDKDAFDRRAIGRIGDCAAHRLRFTHA